MIYALALAIGVIAGLGAAILGTGGDEAIHGLLDMMHAGQPWQVLRDVVPIHPTVSELIPTLLGDLAPAV